ncbi:AraC family transcriptional regulator [Paenibacillus oceani]|uniref:Helix-turn-helix transcriptional regulator n=1 Tax=Paenibacillus oceani TaxID=2772510 RepID=A0A927CDD0_9BACL|nr:AraC family transcriptional regulator [Paenibacillus oceani]MBD2865389.1 helix-turn-helix transcriptional regulator [Paenibacillus oceani]
MISPIAIYFERCETNWIVPPSLTSNHILLLVTEGACIYTVEGNDLHLKRGDALYVPKGVTRSVENLQSHMHWYVAHFRVEGSVEPTVPMLLNNQYLHVRLFNSDYLINRFSDLTQYWLRKPEYYETIYHSVLLEMLAVVNGETDSRQVATKSYSIVMQIQNYIMNHYRTDINISTLARFVDRTPNYISTVFRQVTGRTITEYIQRIRIAEACNMLIHSHMSIGEISDYLGFCEQSYFNKVFKKVTGLPPSAYLRERTKVWRDSALS